MRTKKVPLPKALAIIIVSTLLISGSGYYIMRSWQKHQIKRINDPRFFLRYIQNKSEFPTPYLEELLGLSQESHVSYYAFNEKKARDQLQCYPYIEKAKVSKQFPQNIKISLKLREPFAKLLDFESTLIDQKGYLLPQFPLYQNSTFPEIYLGLKDFDPTIYRAQEFWQENLTGEDFTLALKFFNLLASRDFTLERVDLSNRTNSSLGKREIVLILRNEDGTIHTLRLPAKSWESQLSNYIAMRKECDFFGKDRVIDLRLASLAYITE
ncbi:MAG: hypothetical protein ChlgKO_04080 [Chlamydiales bacterium]